jgi:hypothetical protein
MMNVLDLATRYHEYLRRFGIRHAGDRVAEIHQLDLESVRFFAYASGNALRLKAAITPSGMVTPGGHSDDDWYGFLSRMPTAAAAAERIAWLETDESATAHGLPSRPAAALSPDQPMAVGIDPAEWTLITAPVLIAEPESSATVTAWILDGGARSPTRWRITAALGATTLLERTLAADLVAVDAGSPALDAANATVRARRFLAAGTDDERSWALRHIGDTGDRAAVSDVSALLVNARMLARLGDPAAVSSLGAALRCDAAPEVRRAAAQALSGFACTDAAEVLGGAISEQPDMIVRAEIVHALMAQGRTARTALEPIAGSDPDATIRKLARAALDAIQEHGCEGNH